MAETIVSKLSSNNIISEASFATSVPIFPIEIPKSAATKDGASLTPSPVIAMIFPCDLNKLTILNLCSGLTLAKTLTLFISLIISSSDILSISVPVIILSPFWYIPASSAIDLAVIL